MITMVLHLGYPTVEQSLVGTINFLTIVEDAQLVGNAGTMDAVVVGSLLRQVI